MKKVLIGALAAGALIAAAAPAVAHVTVQPNEAIAGSFSRFVVRVPNERPDAGTVKVQVNFPPIAFVSFEPKDGWERKVRNVELDEPIEAFGQEITESVGSVTWSGGRIGPGEFDEFGFSARMPEEAGPIVFEAIQTYDSGEVVRWVGEADSEEPAAAVTVYDLGLEEGQGELGALAELRGQPGNEAAPDDPGDDGDDEDSPLGIWLGAGALAISLLALIVALRPRRA
jgi:uncharacterized protein YcnI